MHMKEGEVPRGLLKDSEGSAGVGPHFPQYTEYLYAHAITWPGQEPQWGTGTLDNCHSREIAIEG